MPCFRRGYLFALVLMAVSFGPAAAPAAQFTVAARVLCPASLLPAPPAVVVAPTGSFAGPTVLLDTTFATTTPGACAGIRVVVMDADPGFDGYCGAAYTDSRGRVAIRADCGDLIDPLPETYLRIEGKSVLGFSVGVIETDLLDRIADQLENAWDRLVEDGVPAAVPALDQLRSHRTFAWLSPLPRLAVAGASVDAGDVTIGTPAGGPFSALTARHSGRPNRRCSGSPRERGTGRCTSTIR